MAKSLRSQPIPKPWAIKLSRCPLCGYNSLHFSRKAFHNIWICEDLPIQPQAMVRRPGVQPAFQFLQHKWV